MVLSTVVQLKNDAERAAEYRDALVTSVNHLWSQGFSFAETINAISNGIGFAYYSWQTGQGIIDLISQIWEAVVSAWQPVRIDVVEPIPARCYFIQQAPVFVNAAGYNSVFDH